MNQSCAMHLSAADGLQSKEDSVRSDPTVVSTLLSLLFWKGVSGVGIDEEFILVNVYVPVLIIVIFLM